MGCQEWTCPVHAPTLAFAVVMMMNRLTYIGIVAAVSLLLPAEALEVTISQSAEGVIISYPTQSGCFYEVWASTSLEPGGWTGPHHTSLGDGSPETRPFPTDGLAVRFFQVREFELAPSPAEFAAFVDGKNILNNCASADNRFFFDGVSGPEPGNWGYSKTGKGTGLLVLTFDEDANNPAIYREEIGLVFTSVDTVDYVVTIFDAGTPTPVGNGTIVLSTLPEWTAPTDLAPDAAAFAGVVDGKSILNNCFSANHRFLFDGALGQEPGNWTYTKTGSDTGLLTLTFDEDGNDPAAYREEVSLTFTSADTVSYAIVVFNANSPLPVGGGTITLSTLPNCGD
ncbi:MAG: hypothetical protein H7A46_22335 [Verrucomicrobiales bacterium]|nr:hypothetical protein [Verrucomicrobiales bacterium]